MISMKLLLATLLTFLPLAACGGDDLDAAVGATCSDDRECEERCMRGDDYPGGFCTLSCRDDRDCANGAICVDRENGICLFQCDINEDCDFLGPQYRCRDDDDFAGRPVGVCLGN